MKYRKKPVVIEAVRWTGSMQPIIDLLGHDLPTGGNGSIIVMTPEGNMECHIGDWIIKRVKGEFYPCDPDIFELTYEEVE